MSVGGRFSGVFQCVFVFGRLEGGDPQSYFSKGLVQPPTSLYWLMYLIFVDLIAGLERSFSFQKRVADVPIIAIVLRLVEQKRSISYRFV